MSPQSFTPNLKMKQFVKLLNEATQSLKFRQGFAFQRISFTNGIALLS
jgi:hypothetical protein